MAVTSKFLIVKEKNSKDIKYFDYDKIDGYNLVAKKDVHFTDAIDINRVIIINPTFIDKVATKKINVKFNRLINMMPRFRNYRIELLMLPAIMKEKTILCMVINI